MCEAGRTRQWPAVAALEQVGGACLLGSPGQSRLASALWEHQAAREIPEISHRKSLYGQAQFLPKPGSLSPGTRTVTCVLRAHTHTYVHIHAHIWMRRSYLCARVCIHMCGQIHTCVYGHCTHATCMCTHAEMYRADTHMHTVCIDTCFRTR